MTREEAKKILQEGGWLYCYNQDDILMHFNKNQQMCSGTLDWYNGEAEYDCCLYNYDDIEETLGALEFACNGNWKDVSK